MNFYSHFKQVELIIQKRLAECSSNISFAGIIIVILLYNLVTQSHYSYYHKNVLFQLGRFYYKVSVLEQPKEMCFQAILKVGVLFHKLVFPVKPTELHCGYNL